MAASGYYLTISLQRFVEESYYYQLRSIYESPRDYQRGTTTKYR